MGAGIRARSGSGASKGVVGAALHTVEFLVPLICPMENRKPSVKCTCGHSFTITAEEIFKDVVCPACGKLIAAPVATPKSESSSGPKTDPLAPKSPPAPKPEASTGPKTDPFAPKLSGPKTDALAPKGSAPKSDTGTKTDPFAPKGDTTRGTGTPNTARRAPLFQKDGPLPDPIPGYTFQKRLGQGGMGEVFLARQESL